MTTEPTEPLKEETFDEETLDAMEKIASSDQVEKRITDAIHSIPVSYSKIIDVSFSLAASVRLLIADIRKRITQSKLDNLKIKILDDTHSRLEKMYLENSRTFEWKDEGDSYVLFVSKHTFYRVRKYKVDNGSTEQALCKVEKKCRENDEIRPFDRILLRGMLRSNS